MIKEFRMSTRPQELAAWPHINRVMHIDSAGNIESDFISWSMRIRDRLTPADRAAAYEEWADFYEHRLAQQAGELAKDPGRRHLVEKWTDSMAYTCRRSAAWARGDNPGEWISQHERRPDLFESANGTSQPQG